MATPASAPNLSFGGYSELPLETVGAGRRAVARLIDHVFHLLIATMSGVFLGVVIAIVSFASGKDPQAILGRLSHTAGFINLLLSFVGLLAYHAVCEGLHGSTLGKLMMGVSVTTEDSQLCSLAAAIKRSLAYFVDSLFFGLVGYFSIKNSPLHQRHGDKWADTIVRTRAQLDPAQRRGAFRFVWVLALAMVVDWMLITSAVLSELL